MRISQEGLKVIKESEGLRLKSYKCEAGKQTIGYGHVGPEVMPGMTINELAADIYLRMDVASAENAVNKYVKVPINQNQFDALVSLTYNIGAAAFQKSTLLKKLNEGDYKSAADEFLKWNKSNGEQLPGLIIRRNRERNLFLLTM